MIQWKDGTHPQVFCSHDITLCKIDNFMFFLTFFELGGFISFIILFSRQSCRQYHPRTALITFSCLWDCKMLDLCKRPSYQHSLFTKTTQTHEPACDLLLLVFWPSDAFPFRCSRSAFRCPTVSTWSTAFALNRIWIKHQMISDFNLIYLIPSTIRLSLLVLLSVEKIEAQK